MPRVPRPKDVDLIDSLKDELKRAPKPRMSEIAANFIQQCGGPKNFSVMLHNDYTAAAAGSTTRQRIMAMICTLIKTDDEVFDSTAFDDMDKDDLLRVVAEIQRESENLRARDERLPDPADAEGKPGQPQGPAEEQGDDEEVSRGSEGGSGEAEGSVEDWPPEPDEEAEL